MRPKPVVLFGSGDTTRFVHFILRAESSHEVVALTIDGALIRERAAFGLPIVPFEEMVQRYPPDTHAMFIALGYTRVNRLREEKAAEARAMGYELVSHVSPRASTWDDLVVGDNCIIMDEAIVHPFVTIGNNVMMWSGTHIGHGSIIEDNCFFASRSLAAGFVTVRSNCFVGANATIRHGVTIGRGSVIGAGAVITKDTPEWSIYAGPVPRVLPGRSDRLPNL